MKKLTAIVLALILAICVSAPVFADSPSLALESASVEAGNSATLALSLSNNTGIAGISVTLKPDAALSITGVTDNGVFSGFTYATNIVFDSDSNVEANGTIATVTVEVPSGTEAGEYSIQVIVRECVDIAGNDVEIAAVNATITVEEETVIVYGDADGNGKVNTRDIVLIRRSLAGFPDAVIADPVAADADASGKVNTRDIVLIRRNLAGFPDAVLGPQ